MLSNEPVVRSAPKANTASKINELVHNLKVEKPEKKTCREKHNLLAFRYMYS